MLRELYLYREQQSERADRPPFKIMGDRTLVEIAQHCPRRMQGLQHIHGMTYGQVRRYGEGLLKAVQRGKASPHPRPPVAERAPRKVRERYDLLFEWRKEKAKSRGVESDVIVPRNALWELARRDPRVPADLEEIESLGPWRRRTYGDEILAILRKA